MRGSKAPLISPQPGTELGEILVNFLDYASKFPSGDFLSHPAIIAVSVVAMLDAHDSP